MPIQNTLLGIYGEIQPIVFSLDQEIPIVQEIMAAYSTPDLYGAMN